MLITITRLIAIKDAGTAARQTSAEFTKPRCLKNMHSLPVTYKHSKKAWMTAEIWKEWLQLMDRKMAQQKWKVLLFADNCPAHPVVTGLKAVALHFLLPNTTAVLQPMDQGVMQCFKLWYKKLLLGKMGNALNSSIDFTMHITAAAWDHVSGTCVANCFRHAGWQVGSNTEDNRLPAIEEECEALCTTVEAIEQLSKEAQTPTLEEDQMKILCSPSWVGKSWKLQMQKTVMNLHQCLSPTSSNASLQSTQRRVTSIWHGR